MGHIEVANLEFTLPGGRRLFADTSFRVGDGAKAALVGANGTGKTTLLEILAGVRQAKSGSAGIGGTPGVMRQFIGSINDATTIREFLADLEPPALRTAFRAMEKAERDLHRHDHEPTQLAYAAAICEWGELGGYETEITWDIVCSAALGLPFQEAQHREIRSLSGGEQKRLALESLLRGPSDVLLLDEPDNYLDVPGKRWLEEALRASSKTVLLVSHDRELLARAATHIVTIEGHGAWVHGGGFSSYPEARQRRIEVLEQRHRDWEDEHQRLKDLVRTLQQQAKISSAMAAKYRATQTRLARYEAAGPPPERPEEQRVRMRLAGGRTGKRAIICERLELDGLTKEFDLEIQYGERIAVLGANGTGKSHLLRLLAAGGSAGARHDEVVHGPAVAHTGTARLGARVRPGWFAQTHVRRDLTDRSLVAILGRGDDNREGLQRGPAIGALRRYELQAQADQTFQQLSGGQQARFQILLLELEGATLLLLDEPTDNLDLHSAQALEDGLADFRGTVMAVTHDRWFARSFDRFLIVHADGTVALSDKPYWGEESSARV
ncbi:ABC-F family ATP-binding cassette domain-containing protein [Kitasatospora sp. NPDC059571]|uniref:ABC-F family ATP-binding cassette domain-containing protein n=1 Tax=Kitasatospora sp. NPDC059571 TaxID=3346871 RepID=UPI0036AEA415